MESRGESTGNLPRAGSTRLVGPFTLVLGRERERDVAAGSSRPLSLSSSQLSHGEILSCH